MSLLWIKIVAGHLLKELLCKSVYRQCTGNIPIPVPTCLNVCQDLSTCLFDVVGATAILPNCSSVTTVGPFSFPDYAPLPDCNDARIRTLPTDCTHPTAFNVDHEDDFDALCSLGCPRIFVDPRSPRIERILMWVFAPASIVLGLFTVIVSTRVSLKQGFPLSLHSVVLWYTFLSILGYLGSFIVTPQKVICLNDEEYVRPQDSWFCVFQGFWMYHFQSMSHYAFVAWVFGMTYTFVKGKQPSMYVKAACYIVPWVCIAIVDIWFIAKENFGSNVLVSTHCTMRGNEHDLIIVWTVDMIVPAVLGVIGIIIFATLIAIEYRKVTKLSSKTRTTTKKRFARSQAILILWMLLFIYTTLVPISLGLKRLTFSEQTVNEQFAAWIACEHRTPGQCDLEFIPPWWHSVWGSFNVYSRSFLLFLGCLIIKPFYKECISLGKKAIGVATSSKKTTTEITNPEGKNSEGTGSTNNSKGAVELTTVQSVNI